ncbi:phage baseplate assembly protein V [Snodgrassella alvi]|uniref:phage baseplate assembly protein V n=1 Tax=Snodgrassella alvi TaxID=1196083 RepID=UPI0029E4935D|nr:phage baseplate assembly protein V [Snodgrassella alvi]
MNYVAKLVNKTRTTISNTTSSVRQAFRGRLTRVNATEPIQSAQISALADELLQDVEHMQQFGFTSNPPVGSEAIILPLSGQTTHGIIIGTEHGAYRIKALASGEVAVYNQSGASITLKNGRLIEIDCETLNIKAPAGVKIEAAAGISIDAQAGVDITACNVSCSQEITAAGQINGNGGLEIKGGQGATFSGNVVQTEGSFTTVGDVKANGISLTEHDHTVSVGKPV